MPGLDFKSSVERVAAFQAGSIPVPRRQPKPEGLDGLLALPAGSGTAFGRGASLFLRPGGSGSPAWRRAPMATPDRSRCLRLPSADHVGGSGPDRDRNDVQQRDSATDVSHHRAAEGCSSGRPSNDDARTPPEQARIVVRNAQPERRARRRLRGTLRRRRADGPQPQKESTRGRRPHICSSGARRETCATARVEAARRARTDIPGRRGCRDAGAFRALRRSRCLRR